MITCLYCSGAHPWWDCRKAPEGWKPPKGANVPQQGRVGNPSPALILKQPDEPKGETERSHRPSQAGSVGGAGPASKFDKVAYQRAYMRRRRAEMKAK